MNKSSKIFVAGASGMVGSAIIRKLLELGYTNILGSIHTRTLNEHKHQSIKLLKLDIMNQADVNLFFENEKPDYVFMAAAKVGGIHANNTYPAQFIHTNLIIQTNIIHAAYEHNVKRLLFLGSSCIYPKQSPQPMKEEHLLTGILEPTNEPYAIAKIAGIKMCEAYNREYNTQFVAAMPTNLYGPNDNFDLETSHVLPALIRKFHEAKKKGDKTVEIWGTGEPRREFLHVDDMADGCIHIMKLPDSDVSRKLTNYPLPCFVNLGTGKDCSIKELALTIKEITGFKGELSFDITKPDGTLQKLMDVTRLKNLDWQSSISLKDGIYKTYQWFLNNAIP